MSSHKSNISGCNLYTSSDFTEHIVSESYEKPKSKCPRSDLSKSKCYLKKSKSSLKKSQCDLTKAKCDHAKSKYHLTKSKCDHAKSKCHLTKSKYDLAATESYEYSPCKSNHKSSYNYEYSPCKSNNISSYNSKSYEYSQCKSNNKSSYNSKCYEYSEGYSKSNENKDTTLSLDKYDRFGYPKYKFKNKSLYYAIKNDHELNEYAGFLSKRAKYLLKTGCNFTVFAPTDNAFCNSEYDSDYCIDDICSYHILAGLHDVKTLKNDMLYATIFNKKRVRINVYSGPQFNDVVTVNCVPVIDWNIKTKNGFINKIDKKILPMPTKTSHEIISSDPTYSLFNEALIAANMDNIKDNGITIFAPTNEAFNKLLIDLDLMKDDLFRQKKLLKNVLQYHILDSTVCSSAIKNGTTENILTFNNSPVNIERSGDNITLVDQNNRSSNIINADIIVSNGVIHTIDTVLLPSQ